MKQLYSLLIFAGLVINGLIVYGQTPGTNPIFRDAFTADPSPMVYNGRLYVYVGHDEATGDQLFNITEWLCYSTTDMINWTAHGAVMKPTDFSWAVGEAWAAQTVEKDGKFYLYTTVQAGNPNYGKAIGVAVSDSPTGPFVDARGSALVYERDTPSNDTWDDIDPTVWIDDDGTPWMLWGNPTTYIARLNPNMTEIEGEIGTIDLPNYAEGPWLWKKDDLYYVMYPAFVDPVGSEQMCYATAEDVRGPWTYHGVVSPAAQNSYTIHPGVIEYKGNWYMFYHNATLTLNGLGPATGRRSVCVEYMCYNEDGTIQFMPHTTAGVTAPPPCPSGDPTVEFTNPMQGDAFLENETISLSANASDPDGSISTVQFYNGTTLIGSDASVPYSYEWTGVPVGTYDLRVIATDNEGNTAEYNITIRVNVPQGPYSGTVHSIPGTIQLEEFDVGGNGAAYYDDTPGSETGVDFRTNEDVDIEESTDAGGGYNLGWTSAGEWLEYTTEVMAPGVYELEIRAAVDGADRTVSVSMDGEAIATDVAIPNTGGWQTWQTVTVENITLLPGEKVMRLTIGGTDYVNLNYVAFNLVEEFVQEPYNGTPHPIPGRIEAEEYDNGGEGLAYHEANTNGNEGNATIRNDEVDIEETGDTDGAYNIGYSLTGEWLEYSVDVQNTADYSLEVRVAKDGDNGVFHIEMDGQDVTGAINVPNTGGWQTYQTVQIEGVSLTEGEHVMRIMFDSDYTNLNYVAFKSVITSVKTQYNTTSFAAFPNRFTEAITVDVPEAGTITVLDATGQSYETLSVDAGQNTLILNFKSGLYQLIYRSGDAHGILKIIKL